jgi:2-succinyl-6-hydroxy-2,4-cyclohexadiene-1-carboxylate synthase
MPGQTFVDIIDAIAARDLPEVATTVVGYSLGARIALALAMRFPQRVRRLVLVGVAYGITDTNDRLARTRADETLAQALERDGVRSFVDSWEALPLFDSQRSLPEKSLVSQRSWRTAHTSEGLAWSLRCLGLGAQPAYRDMFARSTVPVDVITGALDQKFTSIGGEMVRLRSNVKHTVVAGVGHNVVLEAPEVIARIVAQ